MSRAPARWKQLTDNEVKELREAFARGETTQDVFTRFDIGEPSASLIVCGLVRREAGGPTFPEGIRSARNFARYQKASAATASSPNETERDARMRQMFADGKPLLAISIVFRVSTQYVANLLGLGKVSLITGKLKDPSKLHLVPPSLRDRMKPCKKRGPRKPKGRKCPVCHQRPEDLKQHLKQHRDLQQVMGGQVDLESQRLRRPLNQDEIAEAKRLFSEGKHPMALALIYGRNVQTIARALGLGKVSAYNGRLKDPSKMDLVPERLKEDLKPFVPMEERPHFGERRCGSCKQWIRKDGWSDHRALHRKNSQALAMQGSKEWSLDEIREKRLRRQRNNKKHTF